MSELETAVGEQLETLERELAEIDMLLQQTRDEAERHEQRLKEASERPPGDDPREAQNQLLTLTRRATLMEGQVQVLEGKQKTLRRFVDFIIEVRSRLSAAGGPSPATNGQGPSRALLAAQEEMRREIARRMHDGPAQAIANIALQAELVRRLATHDPSGLQAELDRLGEMVQHALEATKGFIFDVRPMVLDDLGLVATLRRMASERARQSGVPVRFESGGEDRRLAEELESNLFRIVDDAVAGFLAGEPTEVVVRLDWGESHMKIHVESLAPSPPVDSSERDTLPADNTNVPPALAGVLADQREYEARKAERVQQLTALPNKAWIEIRNRALALGIPVELSDDGHALTANVVAPR